MKRLACLFSFFLFALSVKAFASCWPAPRSPQQIRVEREVITYVSPRPQVGVGLGRRFYMRRGSVDLSLNICNRAAMTPVYRTYEVHRVVPYASPPICMTRHALTFRPGGVTHERIDTYSTYGW